MDFKTGCEFYLNLYNLTEPMTKTQFFWLGVLMGQQKKDSLFYRATCRAMVLALMNADVYATQVENLDKLCDDVLGDGQLNVRLLIAGWFSERGFVGISDTDVQFVGSFTSKLKIDIAELV